MHTSCPRHRITIFYFGENGVSSEAILSEISSHKCTFDSPSECREQNSHTGGCFIVICVGDNNVSRLLYHYRYVTLSLLQIKAFVGCTFEIFKSTLSARSISSQHTYTHTHTREIYSNEETCYRTVDAARMKRADAFPA